MLKSSEINRITIDTATDLWYNTSMKNNNNNTTLTMKGNSNMTVETLYVIRRDWTEWLEAFSTLEKAQERFGRFQESNPDWNLQILAEKQE